MAATKYKIDLITKTNNGIFVLVLIQRRKWTGSDAQLSALQQRLNEYAPQYRPRRPGPAPRSRARP